MKSKFFMFFVIFVLAVILSFSFNACGDDDDDDDNNSDDDDDSDWTTLFYDGFEEDNLDSIWDAEGSRSSDLAYAGSYSLLKKYYKQKANPIQHFDFSDCVSAKLELMVYFDNPTSCYMDFSVNVYTTNSHDDFVVLNTCPNNNAWMKATVDMSSYCGWADDLYFDLNGVVHYGKSDMPTIALDDVRLSTSTNAHSVETGCYCEGDTPEGGCSEAMDWYYNMCGFFFWDDYAEMLSELDSVALCETGEYPWDCILECYLDSNFVCSSAEICLIYCSDK